MLCLPNVTFKDSYKEYVATFQDSKVVGTKLLTETDTNEVWLSQT